MAQILKNPDQFSRDDFIKEVSATNCACDNCGQKRKRVYSYFMETAWYKRNYFKGQFCDLNCFRAYQ